jgi:prepilin-type processing-associated H-X9-DG protein
MAMADCPNCGASLPPADRTCPSCRADASIWLARSGQVYGPYTLADLEQAKAEGRIGPEDMVRVGGQQQWQPLAGFMGLPVALPPPPPPPGAPPGYAPARPPRSTLESLAIALVVLCVGSAILGVLAIAAAILFPVFAKAREKARQTSCMANVRLVSLGMMMYAQDHGDRFPPAPLTPESRTSADGIISSIKPESAQAFWPSDNWRSLTLPYVKNAQVYICPVTQSAYSYQVNDALYGLPLKRVKDPAVMAGIYDSGFLTGWPPGPHNKGWNVGFVDGHVKWAQSNSSVKTKP